MLAKLCYSDMRDKSNAISGTEHRVPTAPAEKMADDIILSPFAINQIIKSRIEDNNNALFFFNFNSIPAKKSANTAPMHTLFK